MHNETSFIVPSRLVYVRYVRIFRGMDQNGSRTLDRDELATGLDEFGVSMSSSSFDQLFSYLDGERRGIVTYDEFLESLRVRI